MFQYEHDRKLDCRVFKAVVQAVVCRKVVGVNTGRKPQCSRLAKHAAGEWKSVKTAQNYTECTREQALRRPNRT